MLLNDLPVVLGIYKFSLLRKYFLLRLGRHEAGMREKKIQQLSCWEKFRGGIINSIYQSPKCTA